MAKEKSKKLIHKPKAWLYVPAIWLCRLLSIFYYRLHVTRSPEFRSYKGPLLVIGNHVSYVDPVMMAVAMGSRWKINFVAAGFVMSNKFVRYIFNQIGVIPTTQFVTSPSVTRTMIRLLRQGGCVAYYPEAERRNAGYPEMIDKSTAKFVKLMKVPLAFCRLEGAYLNWPRWAANKLYRGRCFAKMDMLISPHEIETMSVDELHAKILQAFAINDYDWQSSLPKPFSYRRGRTALGLEKILYRCLACGAKFTLTTSADKLFCQACGFTVSVAASGFFTEAIKVKDKSVSNPGEWYALQKMFLRDDMSSHADAFSYEFEGSIAGHAINETYGESFWKKRGYGKYHLNAQGLSFYRSDSSEAAAIFMFKDYLGLMLEHGQYAQFTNSERIVRCYFENPYLPSLVRQVWELAVQDGVYPDGQD